MRSVTVTYFLPELEDRHCRLLGRSASVGAVHREEAAHPRRRYKQEIAMVRMVLAVLAVIGRGGAGPSAP
jgi:hypothetical protein